MSSVGIGLSSAWAFEDKKGGCFGIRPFCLRGGYWTVAVTVVVAVFEPLVAVTVTSLCIGTAAGAV